MIPLYDDNPTRNQPVVTISLIAANVVVFLGQLAMGLNASVFRFGLVPAELIGHANAGYQLAPGQVIHNVEPAWITVLTSMFMHGGLMHIGGNMLFLWIFGNNIEDTLGGAKYLVFYLTCGLAAAAAQVLVGPGTQVPMVGASGAIAGVLGAYLILFPRAQVMTLIIFVFIMVRPLPAKLVLLIWIGLQVLEGLGTFGHSAANMGGVAYAAHVGGFSAGLLLIKLFGGRPEPPPPRYYRPPPDFRRW